MKIDAQEGQFSLSMQDILNEAAFNVDDTAPESIAPSSDAKIVGSGTTPEELADYLKKEAERRNSRFYMSVHSSSMTPMGTGIEPNMPDAKFRAIANKAFEQMKNEFGEGLQGWYFATDVFRGDYYVIIYPKLAPDALKKHKQAITKRDNEISNYYDSNRFTGD